MFFKLSTTPQEHPGGVEV